MRTKNGFFATFAMLVPMTAVPLMAIFGIPQFAPVSASPPINQEHERFLRHLETRVGQSDAHVARHVDVGTEAAAIDFFRSERNSNQRNSVEFGTVSSSQFDVRDPSTLNRGSRIPRQSRSLESSVDLFYDDRELPARRETADTASTSENPQIGDSTPSFDRTDNSFSGEIAERPSTVDERYTRERTVPRRRMRSSTTSASNTLTWQGAVEQLNALGIRTYRLTPGDASGVFQFMCLVTSADDPRISRRFEAAASHPLGAVERVLAQVQNWNRIR